MKSMRLWRIFQFENFLILASQNEFEVLSNYIFYQFTNIKLPETIKSPQKASEEYYTNQI